MDKASFDIECYPNYTLLMFKRLKDNKILTFEIFNNSPINIPSIERLVKKHCIITFNGLGYDKLILQGLLMGMCNEELYDLSNKIIHSNEAGWKIERELGLKKVYFDHIDLMEVAPLSASLKVYGGRMHFTRLMDLPITPNTTINETMRLKLVEYCEIDNDVTIALHNTLLPQLNLRGSISKDLEIDVRSKSDAQIAEATIQSKFEIKPKKPKQKIKQANYVPPDYMGFKTNPLIDLFNEIKTKIFKVAESGHIEMPPLFSDKYYIYENKAYIIPEGVTPNGLTYRFTHPNTGKISNKRLKKVETNIIKIGNTSYKLGIGGIHSMEKSQSVDVKNTNYLLKDYDVASYYPAIILNNGYFPKHLGREFLNVYREIVETRLKAKKEGNKVVADSLKITINGSFGKFASKYSFLYSPDLMMQVTLTGQLSLLMLIEDIELSGTPVISANTDGIVVKIHKDDEDKIDNLVDEWAKRTSFVMEQTHYNGLYSRDVNNYIAVKTDGSVKTKGAFSPPSLSVNPSSKICVDAVVKFITEGAPIEETVFNGEMTDYLTLRAVRGGGMFEGEYLGKVVRWYYSTKSMECITYKTSANLVPKSMNCTPMMDLIPIPDDLDYEYYINETLSILEDLGV